MGTGTRQHGAPLRRDMHGQHNMRPREAQTGNDQGGKTVHSRSRVSVGATPFRGEARDPVVHPRKKSHISGRWGRMRKPEKRVQRSRGFGRGDATRGQRTPRRTQEKKLAFGHPHTATGSRVKNEKQRRPSGANGAASRATEFPIDYPHQKGSPGKV